MYDINFFSVYKKKKSKGSGIKVFLVIFIALFFVGNVILIGGGLLVFSGLQASIDEKEAIINSAETKEKIAQAAKIKQEALLANEYMNLLQDATNKIVKMNTLNSPLLAQVRAMTPATTQLTTATYSGISVTLVCLSSVITDPMDMYHACLNNPIFASVSLSSITVAANGQVSFSIICQLAGGTSK